MLQMLLGVMGKQGATFSLPAPAVTSIGLSDTLGARCNKFVQTGTDFLNMSWGISNTSATGYTAKLYLNSAFNRNVALTSTGLTVATTTISGSSVSPFTASFQIRIDIVRSDGTVVSSMSSSTVSYRSGSSCG